MHCQYVLTVQRTKESGKDDEMLKILPRSMRTRIIMETRTPKVNWHGFIIATKRIHERFFERFVCDCLKQVFPEVDELIFSNGELATDVFFTDSGHVHYSTLNQALKQLHAGHGENTPFALPVQFHHKGEDVMRMYREDNVAGAQNRVPGGRCVAEPGLW